VRRSRRAGRAARAAARVGFANCAHASAAAADIGARAGRVHALVIAHARAAGTGGCKAGLRRRILADRWFLRVAGHTQARIRIARAVGTAEVTVAIACLIAATASATRAHAGVFGESRVVFTLLPGRGRATDAETRVGRARTHLTSTVDLLGGVAADPGAATALHVVGSELRRALTSAFRRRSAGLADARVGRRTTFTLPRGSAVALPRSSAVVLRRRASLALSRRSGVSLDRRAASALPGCTTVIVRAARWGTPGKIGAARATREIPLRR